MDIGTIGNSLTVAVGSSTPAYTGTGVMGLLGSGFYSYGVALLAILTAVIGIGLAYLVFRFGWAKIKGSTR